MSKTLVRKLTVLNRYGLCMGPAGLLAQVCSRVGPRTAVTFSKDGNEVSGKSIMGLMIIEGAQGAVITVKATGPEAREVIDAVTDLFNKGFNRGETLLPIPPAHAELIELEEPP
jgi:phosphocarrier protein HPr